MPVTKDRLSSLLETQSKKISNDQVHMNDINDMISNDQVHMNDIYFGPVKTCVKP